jgi:hypothetical protein
MLLRRGDAATLITSHGWYSYSRCIVLNPAGTLPNTRMDVRTLLLASAGAVLAIRAARAAGAVVVAEPEPVEYVRVCDAYGKGFFYTPCTETCPKVGW